MKNPDGTYNGAKFLSQISGISEEEIIKTFDIAKDLFAQGKTKAEVLEELKNKRLEDKKDK